MTIRDNDLNITVLLSHSIPATKEILNDARYHKFKNGGCKRVGTLTEKAPHSNVEHQSVLKVCIITVNLN